MKIKKITRCEWILIHIRPATRYLCSKNDYQTSCGKKITLENNSIRGLVIEDFKFCPICGKKAFVVDTYAISNDDDSETENEN